ncbi:uncharacterized protein EV420DRAFT_1274355 [Desarmillaria tabescens]|uniref:Uncharacterized protein n=1 Tax=Armillaria tabescens TaxID=1929756 RepID=A0AA39K0J4_ARMTA|nr:uncharacterized protein EV420DRAFT_1274355 [Desarmillaria tabescens]KAK0451166.1 hypothetical protein EV420DRAFT_1274355 [Desarmillaria tabescens]
MSFSFALLSLLHFFAGSTFSQVTSIPYDPSPYAAAGYITGATIDNSSDILSGGTLSINNIDVIIPHNLLVNTPSLTAVAWSELFNENGTIDLPLWPEISWEAQIFANFIGGQYIAGIVYIFQEIANLNEGFITAIDYEKGEFRVGGDFNNPTTGVLGRFGKVHGDWPLWTADTDNPSIQASTGFPLCLPRVDPAVADDPLCPDTNRPVDGSGKPLSGFTFAAPPVPAGQPDPNLFVPLKVGDFIIYSGTIVEDADGRLIAAYSIEGNLGIYTTPGTM